MDCNKKQNQQSKDISNGYLFFNIFYGLYKDLLTFQVEIEVISLNFLHHYQEGQLRLNKIRYAILPCTAMKRVIS